LTEQETYQARQKKLWVTSHAQENVNSVPPQSKKNTPAGLTTIHSIQRAREKGHPHRSKDTTTKNRGFQSSTRKRKTGMLLVALGLGGKPVFKEKEL